jgi:hypothetical protein
VDSNAVLVKKNDRERKTFSVIFCRVKTVLENTRHRLSSFFSDIRLSAGDICLTAGDIRLVPGDILPAAGFRRKPRRGSVSLNL